MPGEVISIRDTEPAPKPLAPPLPLTFVASSYRAVIADLRRKAPRGIYDAEIGLLEALTDEVERQAEAKETT